MMAECFAKTALAFSDARSYFNNRTHHSYPVGRFVHGDVRVWNEDKNG